MKRFLARIKSIFDLNDIFVFTGIAGIGYGASMYDQAAAFIVVGVILFWLGARP